MARQDLFDAILSKNYRNFSKITQGEYIAKFTNQLEQIENQYFSTIPMLFEIIIKILMVTISLFLLNYKIAIITLVLLTMPLYVPKILEAKLQNTQKDYTLAFEDHLKLLSNWFSEFELVKNFSVESFISTKFTLSNNHLQYKSLERKIMSYKGKSLSAILSYYSHFIILAYAAYLVTTGSFTAGDFFIAVGMIDQLSYPIISLSYFIQDLVAIKPLNESIISEIDLKKDFSEILEEQTFTPKSFSSIAIENLDFGYTDKVLLNNINLTFNKNGKYLIKGDIGSGKTTLLDLVMGYHSPNSGEIKINDIDLALVNNLNSIITIMRQQSGLFHDSLRNNLSMYQEISDDKLLESLRLVGLEKFANIDSLNTIVQERGSNLSGGEIRRITLARAILRKTAVLILDEPLANLDEYNVKLIEDLILNIKDKTILIVSHVFSEEKLNRFDDVINLDNISF